MRLNDARQSGNAEDRRGVGPGQQDGIWTGGLSQREGHAGSVNTAFQAGCLAGVWGHSAATRGRLDAGDVAACGLR